VRTPLTMALARLFSLLFFYHGRGPDANHAFPNHAARAGLVSGSHLVSICNPAQHLAWFGSLIPVDTVAAAARTPAVATAAHTPAVATAAHTPAVATAAHPPAVAAPAAAQRTTSVSATA